ncbi:MAG TPA: ABC transporter substrate-binding protein [Marmoricola sp.]|jgi:ABC-type branched-subunit amino acid transport system substrate-binding protein|nr:ABC transporter substrate-binding protein [Marmoricola sp.]
MRKNLRPARLIGLIGAAGLVAAFVVPASGSAALGAPAKAKTCTTSPNRAGETKKTIRIGNASDISGPMPGIHTAAQLATKAYAAYFNASGKRICGRTIVVNTFDSEYDARGDQAAYSAICARDFAAVGSLSDFDNGGATVARQCHVPDLRARSVSAQRNACPTCFGVEAITANEWPNGVPDYFVAHDQAATQKAAMLYLNLANVRAEAVTQEKVATARGFKYLSFQAFDFTDFTYSPYIQQLKSKGVQLVQFLGTYEQQARFEQALHAADYHPQVLLDDSAYDPNFIPQAGDGVADGTVVYTESLPLASSNPELSLYKKWLARVSPGARPTPDGLYAWSAMKLFTTEAVSLGRKLTRASLVTRLRSVKAWTGGGLHTPMAVGPKQLSGCVRFLQVTNGQWVSYGGTAYHCAGVTKAS